MNTKYNNLYKIKDSKKLDKFLNRILSHSILNAKTELSKIRLIKVAYNLGIARQINTNYNKSILNWIKERIL